MLTAQGDEGQARLENLGQLVSSVRTYACLLYTSRCV